MSQQSLEPIKRGDLEQLRALQLASSLDGGSESDFNISEYLSLLRRQWRLIVLAGLVGCLVGAILFATTPRVYQAKSRLQIERRALSPLSSQGTNWLEAWWNPEYYPTQYEILKSRGLAEQVVLDLRLWEDEKFNPGVSLKPIAQKAVTPEHDDALLGNLASRALRGLEVRPKSGTQLVDIVYRSEDPEVAMKLANGFAETFRQLGIRDRSSAASRASSFLAGQIEQIKREIEEKEERLQAYSRERDIVAIDKSSNVTIQRLEAVNQDYIRARSERIQKEVRYHELVATPVEAIADSSADGLISSMRSEKLKLEREYAAKLQIYKPDWPEMLELKGKIDELRRVIEETVGQARDSARAEYQTALRGEERLAQELDDMKRKTLELNSSSVEFNNLRVEISTRRQLLDELVRRQSETSVAVRGSAEPNVHMVERALLPGRPSEPNLQKKVATSGAIGLLLGIGLVLLLDFIDRTIKTPEELERRLGLPVLAVIPDIDSSRGYGYLGRYGGNAYGYGGRKQRSQVPAKRERTAKDDTTIDLIPQLRPRLAISEAYRSLRTALLLSTADELRVIAITSASSGEGKTATAANLATVMAQLGRRVLLIDADLRKPRTHQIFRVSNRVGLVNYLVGRAEPEEICFRNGVPNLAVVPAGPVPPNPSELLASPRMKEFLTRARASFDFIIIDTPPTLAVTDSTLMGDLADGVVLCVRSGAIPRDVAKLSADRLRLSGVKILGTVLNCYRPLHGRYSRDYHYYYYQAYAEATDEGDRAAG